MFFFFKTSCNFKFIYEKVEWSNLNWITPCLLLVGQTSSWDTVLTLCSWLIKHSKKYQIRGVALRVNNFKVSLSYWSTKYRLLACWLHSHDTFVKVTLEFNHTLTVSIHSGCFWSVTRAADVSTPCPLPRFHYCYVQ